MTSLLPLAGLGLLSAHFAAGKILRQSSALEVQAVDHLAGTVEAWIDGRSQMLHQQLEAFSLETMDEESQQEVVQLVYRQTEDVHIALLFDVSGTLIASAWLSMDDPAIPDRETIEPARLQELVQAIEGLRLAPGETAVGTPYTPAGRELPVVPLVVAAESGAVLAVELGMDVLLPQLMEREGFELALLDGQGRVVLASSQELIVPHHFRPFLGRALVADIHYATPIGVKVLAACTPIQGTSWTAVTAAPVEQLTASSRQLQLQTAYVGIVAGLLSVVVGLLLARQITRPVIQLRDAALEVAAGKLGGQVPVAGSDELSALGRSFNLMSTSLARSAEVIEAKNHRIEAFNQELQARVDERTRQLKATQGALIRSEKLAAVGELGAGLAHELNNPMTGILGMTQLLRAQSPDDPMLRAIEEQAQRCRKILTQLRLFSEGEPTAERGDLAVVELGEIVEGVLALIRGPFRQRGIQVSLSPLPPLPTRGDRAALGRAITQLMMSLRAAVRGGGILTISPEKAPHRVGLRLILEGDLDQGGDAWMASGMGLWAARQIFAAHGGELQDLSKSSQSFSAWLLWLPEA